MEIFLGALFGTLVAGVVLIALSFTVGFVVQIISRSSRVE